MTSLPPSLVTPSATALATCGALALSSIATPSHAVNVPATLTCETGTTSYTLPNETKEYAAECPSLTIGTGRFPGMDTDGDVLTWFPNQVSPLPRHSGNRTDWEFVVVQEDGTVHRYAGDPGYGFQTTWSVEDLNGDGYSDIVYDLYARPYTHDRTYYITTPNAVGTQSPLAMTINYGDATLGDFDTTSYGDEVLSLNLGFDQFLRVPSYADPATTTSTKLNPPPSCVVHTTHYVTPEYTTSTVADVNGDGNLDAQFWLVCGETPTQFNALGDGQGNFDVVYTDSSNQPAKGEAPVAVYDMVAVQAGKTTILDPMANDTFADGVSVVSISDAVHGEVRRIEGTNTFRYYAPKYPQYEALTYVIEDDYGQRSTQVIHLCDHYTLEALKSGKLSVNDLRS